MYSHQRSEARDLNVFFFFFISGALDATVIHTLWRPHESKLKRSRKITSMCVTKYTRSLYVVLGSWTIPVSTATYIPISPLLDRFLESGLKLHLPVYTLHLASNKMPDTTLCIHSLQWCRSHKQQATQSLCYISLLLYIVLLLELCEVKMFIFLVCNRQTQYVKHLSLGWAWDDDVQTDLTLELCAVVRVDNGITWNSRFRS